MPLLQAKSRHKTDTPLALWESSPDTEEVTRTQIARVRYKVVRVLREGLPVGPSQTQVREAPVISWCQSLHLYPKVTFQVGDIT